MPSYNMAKSDRTGPLSPDRKKRNLLPYSRTGVIMMTAAASVVAGLGLTALPVSAAQSTTCQAATSDGPVFVTETCTDAALAKAYVDVDEQRTVTDPKTNTTVGYRYIHGGFSGSNATFSLYFPTAENYKGRFFQSTYPTVGHDDADPTALAFSLSHGAYVVQTNNGGGVFASGGLGGYRINAAAAKYSRTAASMVYPGSDRPRGYLYGLSGGAYQTIGGAENTEGVWDGAAPAVLGVPNSLPSYSTVVLLALRVLDGKLPQIADAMEPGGSGDPYAGLTEEEARILREVTRMGFPLRAWWNHAAMDTPALASIGSAVRAIDSSYENDFWAKKGYAGTDPNESAAAARIQADATVTGILGEPATGLVLTEVPEGYLVGSELVTTSGAASGKKLPLGTVQDNSVSFGPGADPSTIAQIQPGDELRIDNSWYTALQYYHRYQVPTADMSGWNQFRDAAGSPNYPQRSFLLGPLFAGSAGGAVATGDFKGKMIMLSSLLDAEAYPWSADWYRNRAQSKGKTDIGDRFRLWYTDNAGHYTPSNKAAEAHVISYDGAQQQALLDLDAWVLNGTPPSPSTGYSIDADNQIHVPSSAPSRRGIQPTVEVRANKSAETAIVEIGQPVTFSVDVRVPPATGKIVKIEWGFEGSGDYSLEMEASQPAVKGRASTHRFTKPGTYFAVVRVTAQRNGDTQTPFTQVQNLDRVRVVVH